MGPMITVRYFAAAKAAAAVAQETVELPAGEAALTRDALFTLLAQRHPDTTPGEPSLARVLAQSTCLVDGMALLEDQTVADGATADVLPPFAGG